MKLSIKQRGHGALKWKHPRLEQAVVHIARTLRIPNPKELDITLKLSFDKRLVEKDEGGNVVLEAPNTYTITMQGDAPWSWTIKTLAHELVHVHQFQTGRLQSRWVDGQWQSRWQEGRWKNRKDIPYDERPWEIEAREKEEGLQESFFSAENPIGTYYLKRVE